MSKKANKSASKEVASYNERDIVLGKVRGFPPWPGMVVNPDAVPDAVQAERPGKKSNFYCVQFFPAGDYAWLPPKDISKLQPVEIESYINEPFKKSGDLLQGYKTALDPTVWEAKRASDLAAAAAEASDEGDEEDKEEDNVDELASDSESKKPTKSRKRKRESLEPKTRKTPKERERAAKEGAGAKGGKKGAEGGAKPKKGRKSKAMVESEDERAREGDDDAEGEEVAPSGKNAGSPPPAKKARREDDAEEATHLQTDPEAIKVRDWRHRLQKAFLSAKAMPDEGDMPALDVLFSTVEAYEQMTVAYLQFSKIGKVMRHITVLEDKRIPRDAEFQFKKRAHALVERWQNVLGAAKEGASASASASIGKPIAAAAEKKDLPKKDAEKEKKEVVNGTASSSSGVNGKPLTNGDGETVETEGEVKTDVNGAEHTAAATETADAQGDADMAAPDTDAPGEADNDVDAAGQADAPGETEDVAMTEE